MAEFLPSVCKALSSIPSTTQHTHKKINSLTEGWVEKEHPTEEEEEEVHWDLQKQEQEALVAQRERAQDKVKSINLR
jgi:hypothetical protein